MKSNKIVLIVLLLVGFTVFLNGLKGDFIHDDLIVLSHSFYNQPGKIFNFFSQPYFENFYQAGLYRPLTQISFGLNFLFGSSPFGFHLVNVFLHIFNSFLVFLFLKKFTKGLRLSLIAALLFLVLPIHVEAVTSIVGRAELLSFFFGVSTLLLWLNSKYFFSAITLFLAFLSKETAIAVPAIVLLFNLSYRKSWKWTYYYIGFITFYFILRIVVLGRYAFQDKNEFIFNPLTYVSFYERFSTALKILVIYIQKIFVPLGLSADYSYNQIPVVGNLLFSLLSLTGLAILGLMLWAVYPHTITNKNLKIKEPQSGNYSFGVGVYHILRWASVLFFLPYLVISNLIFTIGTIMADRLMYFPSFGAAMILGLTIDHLFKHSRQFGLVVLLALMFIYGLLTVNQNKIWSSREALLTSMFERSPDSVVAKANYGILMLDRDKELAKRLSLEVYDKYPDYIQNLNLRAAVEVQEGNFTEAEKFLERALELRPKHQNTLHNLSRVYFTLGKYEEAEETLRVLVSEYGGQGNVIFYALVLAKAGYFDQSHQVIYSFFGPEVEDESALKILRGELKELENFYRFSQ